MENEEELTLSIIAAECRSACSEEPDLAERIKKAMQPVVHEHWMSANEDVRFRGALAAVYTDPLTTDEDKQRIKYTLEQMRSLNAMMSGVRIDIEAFAANPDEIEPVPLVKLWNDAKAVEARSP